MNFSGVKKKKKSYPAVSVGRSRHFVIFVVGNCRVPALAEFAKRMENDLLLTQ